MDALYPSGSDFHFADIGLRPRPGNKATIAKAGVSQPIVDGVSG